MKTYLLFILSFWTVAIFAQNKDAEFRADHVGKDMSAEQIQALFEHEQEMHQSAIEMEGKISIIPNNQFEQVFGNKASESMQIDLKDLKGKKYYDVKDKVDELSSRDFKSYYKSLDDNNRRKLLTYGNLDHKCKSVFKDRDLQVFILSEFDRIKKTNNKKNRTQIYKIDFIQKVGFPGARDSILALFATTPITDFTNKHGDLMLYIYGNEEMEALQCYEQKVDEFLIFMKDNPGNNNAYLPFNNKKLFISFLYAKNPTVSKEFINHSLKIIKQDILHFSKISNLVGCLWNSGKLTDSQIESLLQALENSKSADATKILSEYKLCLQGINVIDEFPVSYIQDSLSLELFYPIVSYGLSQNDGNKLMDFIDDNEENLKKNTSCFRCSMNYIRNRVNSTTKLNRLDSIMNVLNPEHKVDSMNLFKEYYESHLYGAATISRPINVDIITNALLEKYFSVYHFDTEIGIFPVDYDNLLIKFGQMMQKETGEKLHIKQVVKNYEREKNNDDEIVYSVSVGTKSSKIYNVELPNSGDWYSMSSIITALNLILKDKDSNYRWVSADTGDQTSKYILITLDDYKIVEPLIRFIIRY